MPVTEPPVPQIPAGWGPVAADFETWITNPFTFLSTPPVFRGQLQGSESVPGAPGWTLAELDTILEDPYSGWSAAATGSQAAYSWLCPAGCSGWYDVSITAHTGDEAGTIAAGIYVDGSLYVQVSGNWTSGSTPAGSSGAVPVPLLGGSDYVQAYIYTSSSTSTPATAGQYPTMEIAWTSS
jgi:hypothetical protein